MNDKLPLSKETQNLQEEVRELKSELRKLDPLISKTLADDKSDLEKIGATLSTLTAKKDILSARLARRKEELFKSFIADARASSAAATAEFEKAKEAWRLSREHWREAVLVAHPKGVAEGILHNPQMAPFDLKNAMTRYNEARKFMNDATHVLHDCDMEFRLANYTGQDGGGAFPADGISRVWPESKLRDNATKFCPEIA